MSTQTLPMEPRAKVEPGSGEHSVSTNFPKDPNWDTCSKTKIRRSSCRRRAGTIMPRAAHDWWVDFLECYFILRNIEDLFFHVKTPNGKLFRLRPVFFSEFGQLISTSADIDFGQYPLRPISTSASWPKSNWPKSSILE